MTRVVPVHASLLAALLAVSVGGVQRAGRLFRSLVRERAGAEAGGVVVLKPTATPRFYGRATSAPPADMRSRHLSIQNLFTPPAHRARLFSLIPRAANYLRALKPRLRCRVVLAVMDASS